MQQFGLHGGVRRRCRAKAHSGHLSMALLAFAMLAGSARAQDSVTVSTQSVGQVEGKVIDGTGSRWPG